LEDASSEFSPSATVVGSFFLHVVVPRVDAFEGWWAVPAVQFAGTDRDRHGLRTASPPVVTGPTRVPGVSSTRAPCELIENPRPITIARRAPVPLVLAFLHGDSDGVLDRRHHHRERQIRKSL